MAEIKLRPEEAREHASDIKKTAADTQAEVDAMRARLQGLADAFTGQAAVAFDERFNEWDTGAKQLLDALDSLGQFLEAAANTIEETDSTLADQLRG